MYQAPIVALVIIIAYVWRWIVMCAEKRGKEIPIFAHYPPILYLLTLVLTFLATKSLYTDVLKVSAWLDPTTVEKFVREVMEQSDVDNKNLSASVATWKEETDISGMPWLRWLAISTPLWCIGTMVVCALHSFEHIKRVVKNGNRLTVGDGENAETLWSDNIVLILALPMIYGLMSFKSVIRCLQIYINHVPASGQTDANHTMYSGYEERKDFLNEMYAANFAVGDLMETIALVTFGELIAAYLKHRMEITKKHMVDKKVEEEDIHTLVAATDTVSSLTIAGVQLFCLACILSSAWELTLTTMPFYFKGIGDAYFSTDPENLGSLQQEATRASAEEFFLGFSFAASFAAIGNIMTLEENYHHFLVTFVPSLKFWGTKILVSLACVQSCILGCLPGTPAQHNLIYACMLSIECFLIAIFHFKAWGATEEWLDHQHDHKAAGEALRRSRTSLQEPLINKGQTPQ